MKRPLPSTAAAPCPRALVAMLLLLLPTSMAQIDEETAARKKDKDKDKEYKANCAPLLAQALDYDADGSGGLDRAEWAQLWSGIGGAPSTIVDDTYDLLQCESCHGLGLPESCCDDTATDDEVEVDEGKDGVVWTEISLVDFGDDRPGKGEMKYHKRFCEEVELALEVEALASASGSTVAATTAASATESATTESVTTSSGTTTAVVETSTVASTEASTTTSTTITTTSTSTEETTTTTATTTPGEIEPLVLTFIGSTGGSVVADDVDMDEVSQAFWSVSVDILEDIVPSEEVRRKLFWDFTDQIMMYFDGVVMDGEDIDCPSGLAYAEEGEPCVEFTYTLYPISGGPLTESLADEFTSEFYEAVDEDGELYDEYPGTDIIGLGSPGKGQPLSDANAASASQIVELEVEGGDSKSTSSTAIPVGGIIGIALAAALVAFLIVAMVVRRRRNQRRQLNDSNLSEDIEADEVNADAEWFDEEHDDDHRVARGPGTPSSSLAAMGVASTVATRLTTGDTEVMLTDKQAWTKREPDV